MTVDPETEVCVTCGSTEAMIASMLGVLDPGDEVVIFEPYYEEEGPAAAALAIPGCRTDGPMRDDVMFQTGGRREERERARPRHRLTSLLPAGLPVGPVKFHLMPDAWYPADP
jgi:aminotransferase